MKAEEALRAVREARQQMVDSWEGKTDEEIIRGLNEKARRVMAELQQESQAASSMKSSEPAGS